MPTKLFDVLYILLIRISQQIRLNILRCNSLVVCKHSSCLIKFYSLTVRIRFTNGKGEKYLFNGKMNWGVKK